MVTPNMTPGLVPLPEHHDRPIYKPEGNGQNNLGKRDVKFAALHRMLGSLWGTDTFFRGPVGALTDWGVHHLTGEAIKWNDPYGYASGWASGPVSAPYGDGAAFIAKHGVNGVNRFGVSIEISGFQTDPVSEAAWDTIAQIIAHYAHDAGITWEQFPDTGEGFSFTIWHQEFTIGTGKQCPFTVVMDGTPQLIERVRAILKAAQVVATDAGVPTVPLFAPPVLPAWWGEEALADGEDREHEGVIWHAVTATYTARKDTRCTAWAGPDAPNTRTPVRTGEKIRGYYRVRASDGKWYVVTRGGSRLRASSLSPFISIDEREAA